MEKIRVEEVVVEVGRKCTRECEICLRGCGEDKTIDIDSVKHILDQTDSIGAITFTGGEPTLYSKQIAEIVDYIVANHIQVENFYIASNGEIYSHELMTALIKLYAYIQEFSDAECTAYDVSNDRFHNPDPRVISKLKAFSFFQLRGDIHDNGIIAEGFAETWGRRHLNYGKMFHITVDPDYDSDDVVYTFDMLYLNAVGKLLADCNYSFKTQRELDAPNYDEFTLVELAEHERYSCFV